MASHNLLTVQGIETLSTMESERPLIDALGGGGYAIAFINNTSGISYLVVEDVG